MGKEGVAVVGAAAISAEIENNDSKVAGEIRPETVAAPEAVGWIPRRKQTACTFATPAPVRQGLLNRI